MKNTRTVLTVALLVALALVAGCGEPGGGVTDDAGGDGVDAGGTDDVQTTDNDAGAEPVAPNGTESELTPSDTETATRTPQEALESPGGVIAR